MGSLQSFVACHRDSFFTRRKATMISEICRDDGDYDYSVIFVQFFDIFWFRRAWLLVCKSKYIHRIESNRFSLPRITHKKEQPHFLLSQQYRLKKKEQKKVSENQQSQTTGSIFRNFLFALHRYNTSSNSFGKGISIALRSPAILASSSSCIALRFDFFLPC